MILVTGATGFIGRRLTERLIARGDEVRAFARRPPAGLSIQGGEMVLGDVADADAVGRATRGCDIVVHLAARRARWHRDPRVFERTNVQGTRNVLEAAARVGVRKVLIISTYLVLGPSGDRLTDERDFGSLTRFHSEYQRTKYLADQEARRYCEQGLPVVELFPASCYGPTRRRGESPVTDVARAAASGRPVPLVGNGDHPRSLVFMGDVVQGLIAALDFAPPGQQYILGGDNTTVRQFLACVAEVAGRPVRTVPVSEGMARAAGSLVERLAPVIGVAPVTRSTFDILFADWAVSSEKAERELGYRITPLKEGLQHTLTRRGDEA